MRRVIYMSYLDRLIYYYPYSKALLIYLVKVFYQLFVVCIMHRPLAEFIYPTIRRSGLDFCFLGLSIYITAFINSEFPINFFLAQSMFFILLMTGLYMTCISFYKKQEVITRNFGTKESYLYVMKFKGEFNSEKTRKIYIGIMIVIGLSILIGSISLFPRS